MKKLSVAKQVLNLLNTQGGKKPKQIITETKASAGSVYNALNQLRSRKMVAKEEDGVYISQTQTSVSDVTNKVTKRGRPTRVDMLNIQYVENLEKENKQLTEWTQMWKRKYEV
jgi:Fe2+ or Zn2+ uptake regulation protein